MTPEGKRVASRGRGASDKKSGKVGIGGVSPVFNPNLSTVVNDVFSMYMYIL